MAASKDQGEPLSVPSMTQYLEDQMKSRMREICSYGSVRG